jgi:hypothetical protein
MGEVGDKSKEFRQDKTAKAKRIESEHKIAEKLTRATSTAKIKAMESMDTVAALAGRVDAQYSIKARVNATYAQTSDKANKKYQQVCTPILFYPMYSCRVTRGPPTGHRGSEAAYTYYIHNEGHCGNLYMTHKLQ